MRKNPPSLLPLLRSEMQADLLGALLLQPTRAWSLDELTSLVGAPVSSVHRELLRAVDAGLVVRDDRQRPHRYKAAKDSPAYRPMRDLLELTVGVTKRLRDALCGIAGLRAAAIHGGWARGRVTPTSDIDVIVVIDGDEVAAQRAIRHVCRKAGRDADISLLSRDAVSEMVKLRTPFWEKVLAGPRIDLVGDLETVSR